MIFALDLQVYNIDNLKKFALSKEIFGRFFVGFGC